MGEEVITFLQKARTSASSLRARASIRLSSPKSEPRAVEPRHSGREGRIKALRFGECHAFGFLSDGLGDLEAHGHLTMCHLSAIDGFSHLILPPVSNNRTLFASMHSDAA
jgi:hypothetical protein